MATASVTLTVTHGPLDGRSFRYDERTTAFLGRARDCNPQLPDDDDHRTVSRHHCLLDINPPDVRIRDFGSLNGTYLNGLRIGRRERGESAEQAAARAFPEHDLEDGDEVRLGDTVFKVGIHTAKPQQTLVVPRCVHCGADVGGEVGDRTGDYVCANCRSDPDELAREYVAGSWRAGRYEIVQLLGEGGMGRVYLARDIDTGELVALKMMLPEVAADPHARAQFMREISVSQALEHPNIARTRDADSYGGVFFFTSEYCAGGSLAERYRKRPVPVDEALPLVLQALDGLEHAHAHGVVHRDLTPHNILLTADGTVKLADFGLAKAFDLAGLSGLTRTGTAAGKPYFMPYQQVVNFRYVRPEVDVWSLAACLYHLLTGVYPRDFDGGRDPWQVVLQTVAVPLLQRRPDVPRDLALVVDTALQDRPAIGYPTAAEFRNALLLRAM
ncbi:protein kinase [Dactylosporangium vinaceum]|uniref:non-specific serine/threonine protein kinase n=1 Tax=Dactylosporangium vinaceum TaxID=53362 RepID=A0ABV5MRI3_9ACTN|nr:protein kinase [Dactylosporangium vinaceum]UAC00437.1 protein kinase [Dactylosporangium vinaceum]